MTQCRRQGRRNGVDRDDTTASARTAKRCRQGRRNGVGKDDETVSAMTAKRHRRRKSKRAKVRQQSFRNVSGDYLSTASARTTKLLRQGRHCCVSKDDASSSTRTTKRRRRRKSEVAKVRRQSFRNVSGDYPSTASARAAQRRRQGRRNGFGKDGDTASGKKVESSESLTTEV